MKGTTLGVSWVATSYGALDVRDSTAMTDPRIECVVLPTFPSEPLGLHGDVAALWRRLVEGPVFDESLSAEQQALVLEFEQAGLASRDVEHPARTTTLSTPWLVSPLHELVYALVASIGRDAGVELVFIKGPMLHRQGLRDRQHSGDVDLWVDPEGLDKLRDCLLAWGWTVVPTSWGGIRPSHSITLMTETWGCEIDIHYDFPGVGQPGYQAFATLRRLSEPTLFAGMTGLSPAPTPHAIIHALHKTRPRVGRRSPQIVVFQSADMLKRIGPETLDCARELRADAALSPVLKVAFPEEFVPPSYGVPLTWSWRMQSNRLLGFILALRLIPKKHRLSALFRVAWPRREQILAEDPTIHVDSRAILRARWRRLKRGLGNL